MDKIDEWVKSGTKHEGFYPGSASQRNNNPGNFRCSPLVMGELGAIKCVNNLAVFPDLETGKKAFRQFLIYACTDKLKSYKSSMTLLEFYERYAPSSDHNNPLNYASVVAKDLGVSIHTQIKDLYNTPATTPVEETKTMQLLGQRDSKWANVTIGNSKSILYYYGCTITCISMLSSWYGCFKDPGKLAKILRFSYDLILWQSIAERNCFEFIWRQYGYNEKRILDSVNGKTTSCILQINKGHWVVAIKKNGDQYYVADPWYPSRHWINKKIITGSAHFDIKLP